MDTKQLKDSQLLTMVIEGNKHAEAGLYTRYKRTMLLAAMRIVGCPDLAEGIVTDAFMSVMSKAKDVHSNVGGVLVRAARNKAIDHTRKAASKYESGIDSEQALDSRNFGENDALDAFESESIERVFSTVLTAKQKEVMVLSLIKGYDIKAIAEELQIGIATVKTHLLNAREVLRKYYNTHR